MIDRRGHDRRTHERRARQRYPFTAIVEIEEPGSGMQITASGGDLAMGAVMWTRWIPFLSTAS
jgi:hypothetical protein